MKGRTIYIIGIVGLLAFLILLTLQLPRQFIWEETYGTRDTQPYGCYAFDSLMRQTLPHGYRVSSKPLHKLAKEKGKPRNYLIMADDFTCDSLDFAALYAQACRGSRIVLATRRGISTHEDSVLFKHYGVYFHYTSYRSVRPVRGLVKKTPVYWPKDSRYGRGVYRVPDVLLDGYIVRDTFSTFQDHALILNNDTADVSVLRTMRELKSFASIIYGVAADPNRSDHPHPVATTCRVGKGEITFVCMPLLFSNYGILMEQTRGLTLRLMDRLSNAPVVRTDYYCPVSDRMDYLGDSGGPTDFFLQHPALRLALRLTALLIVLLMLFKARRRQRAIPVYRQPENHTLEFVQLIGSLYYQRRDNLDLLRKKYRIFAETLRRRLAIDVTTAKDQPSDVDQLTQRTGLDADYLTRVLIDTRNAYFAREQLADNDMKRLIEQMNEITEKL